MEVSGEEWELQRMKCERPDAKVDESEVQGGAVGRSSGRAGGNDLLRSLTCKLVAGRRDHQVLGVQRVRVRVGRHPCPRRQRLRSLPSPLHLVPRGPRPCS